LSAEVHHDPIRGGIPKIRERRKEDFLPCAAWEFEETRRENEAIILLREVRKGKASQVTDAPGLIQRSLGDIKRKKSTKGRLGRSCITKR